MRADQIRERLLHAGAATVYEAAGRRGALDPGIRQLIGTEPVAGPAVPVRCHPGDNLAVHRVMEDLSPGDVLVVDGAGVLVGYLGDILGTAALARGAIAAVIDGGARDQRDLAKLGFAVWARGPAIPGAAKLTAGTVGTSIVCGGVHIRPGDWIVADADGVVAVDSATLTQTIDGADARLASEERVRNQLREGALTLDLFELRKAAGH
jgi:4-hydroxy-4-methyl-2-oxoglutarate aldolase